VDKPTIEKLVMTLTDVITSGALDKLHKSIAFHTLAMNTGPEIDSSLPVSLRFRP